ncbi:MAG: potassium/proton antiporter [Bacteroidales bacterium]
MTLTPENILLFGSTMLFVSVLASKAGARTGIPVLLFLMIGMLTGVDGLGINYSNPDYTQFIGNIALVIILFSGGMDTQYPDIKRIIREGIILSTFGVILTTAITGIFIWMLLKGTEFATCGCIGILDALLLAAIMSSTDSASVFGILRGKGINIRPKVKSLLEFESGSNDPMAYLLTIILIQLIQSTSQPTIPEIIWQLFLQLSVGFILGFILGRLTVLLMNNINLNNHSLYAVLLLSCSFLIFTITSSLLGNGFLAVYIAGMVIGNQKVVHRKSISNFTDGLAWLFQIIMFLTLGLLVNPHEMVDVALEGFIIGLFLIFIARPLMVFLCLSFSHRFSFKSKLFISWVGLRGAVPIIFATYPLTAKMPEASLFFNIVFFITLLSLLLQGISIPWMAKILHQEGSKEVKKSDFGMELPDDIKGAMAEIEITEPILRNGSRVMSLPLPDNTLVVMIKRKERYLIPKGHTILKAGDKLLLIADNENGLKQSFRQLGIFEDTPVQPTEDFENKI